MMFFTFLRPFFPDLFSCILRTCLIERTYGELYPLFPLFISLLALLNSFDDIFDSILDSSIFS